jgi:hypothetical protein
MFCWNKLVCFDKKHLSLLFKGVIHSGRLMGLCPTYSTFVLCNETFCLGNACFYAIS